MESSQQKQDLQLIDTEDALTMEELRELKKLANLSKTTRVVFGVIFGILALTGINPFITWLSTLFSQAKGIGH
jgi:hypothetical protein